MDSSGEDDKKAKVVERFKRTPYSCLLTSAKELLSILLEPDLVSDHKRREIIERAGKAVLDATAEVN